MQCNESFNRPVIGFFDLWRKHASRKLLSCKMIPIYGNDITSSNSTGIYIAESASNSIIGNNVTDSDRSVYTEYCGANIFHHNNFVDNTQQWYDIAFTPWPIPLQFSVSVWDDDTEGNYWSDYEDKYSNATELDSSGTWNTPYVLDENNKDNNPLIEPHIIPEFPSWAPILLTFTVLAVVLVLYRKEITSQSTST